jgi:predicted dehydrogenase
MFFGRVSKVSCFTNNIVHQYQAEDGATALLSFENGAMGSVDTFFCIPDAGSKNALELYGSKGSILAKGTIGQSPAGEMVAYLEEQGKDYDAQQTRAGDKGIIVAPQPVNTYRAEIEEFSQAIIDDRKTVIDAELGLRSQKILTACYESAESGRVVEVK